MSAMRGMYMRANALSTANAAKDMILMSPMRASGSACSPMCTAVPATAPTGAVLTVSSADFTAALATSVEAPLRPRERVVGSMSRNPWTDRPRTGDVEGLIERHPEAFSSLRPSDVATAGLSRSAAGMEEEETLDLIETADRLAEQSLEVREDAVHQEGARCAAGAPICCDAPEPADGRRVTRPAGPGSVEKSG